MVQKELYNVREYPQERGAGGRKKGSHPPPFVLCLIKPDRNSHPRMVSSSPRIKSPSNSVFLVPAQPSLTSTLTVVKLIKA